MTAEPRRMFTRQIYRESCIMYICHVGAVETKPNGPNNIGGGQPAFSKMHEQVDYGKGSS